MPPKPKFTKEQIIEAAFAIVREKGIEAMVAREVGQRLGTSATPIFTLWNSMDELQQEVIDRAWQLFDDYLRVADDYVPAFKKRGMQLVRFATEEPHLFRLLFLTRRDALPFDQLMQRRLHGFEEDVRAIREEYHMDAQAAQHLFNQMWLHAYGICVLQADGICSLADQQVATLLGEMFAGMLAFFKSGGSPLTSVIPAEKSSPEGQRIAGTIPHLAE